MQLPKLNSIQASRSMTDSFEGYNHNLRIKESESYDLKNMSCEEYPTLKTRKKRATILQAESPAGMLAKDALAYIDQKKLYYNFKEVQFQEDKGYFTLTDGEKQIVGMGALLLIFPDKVFYNTQSGEAGYLEAKYDSYEDASENAEVTFAFCNVEGEPYTVNNIGSEMPENPENGEYWLDTSQEKNTLKVWSETSSMWVPVSTVYVRIGCTGIGKKFKQYDGVKIDGCTAAGTTEFNNTAVIWARGDDFITIVGLLEAAVSQTDKITVSRTMPDFDFVTESGNRLWGCKYGQIDSGETVNEIYASKLGDPTNFNCFMGVSTDSYAASLGSDGAFTGAVSYGGYPVFFKENCIHKVYGNIPANFQIQNTNARGVQKGSEKSLCIVNEVLYYKSVSDVCAYDGGLPATISAQLGTVPYKNAVAGEVGGVLYLSMQGEDGNWTLFTYNTYSALWAKEDDTKALCFARLQNDLLYFDGENKLKSVSGKIPAIVTENGQLQTELEEDFDFLVESGYIGFSSPDNKQISRFNIRMILPKGSEAQLYLQYDNASKWEKQFQLTGNGLQSFTISVVPHRCDHMKYNLCGKGECKILSITRLYTEGSDVR